jgi:hypothetical protein
MKTLIEYLHNNLGVSIDAASTIIITLSIFIVGYILKGLYNLIKSIIKLNADSRSRKHYRRIFNFMIKAIYGACIKQSEVFAEFSKNLTIENVNLSPIKPVNISLLLNFQKIPFETFYDSFFRGRENKKRAKNNKTLEHFNEIYSITETLSYSEKKYIEDFKDFNLKYDFWINHWNVSFGRINTFINDRLDKAFKVLPLQQPDMFYFSLNQIINDWQEQEDKNGLYTMYNKFLLPFVTYLNEQENRSYADEFRSLSNDISQARGSFHNMEYCFANYQKQFHHYETSYTSKASMLENSLNQLHKCLK